MMGLLKSKCKKCGEVFDKSEWNGKGECPVCVLREEIRDTKIEILGVSVNVGDVMDSPTSLVPPREPVSLVELSRMPLEKMKENAVTHVGWVAEPDACEGCKMLDGCVYDITSAILRGEGHKHVGCRCSWVPLYGLSESGLPMPPRDRQNVEHNTMPRARFRFASYEPSEGDCTSLERSFKPVVLKQASWVGGEYREFLKEELFLCVWRMYLSGVQILDCDWLISVLDDCITGGLNGHFMARAHRLRGDLYLLQGDDEIALNAYDCALAIDARVGCKRQRDALKKDIENASL